MVPYAHTLRRRATQFVAAKMLIDMLIHNDTLDNTVVKAAVAVSFSTAFTT